MNAKCGGRIEAFHPSFINVLTSHSNRLIKKNSSPSTTGRFAINATSAGGAAFRIPSYEDMVLEVTAVPLGRAPGPAVDDKNFNHY